MEIYKLKHKPTGLYFQPHKHRGSHLSKRGKIYQTATHGLSSVMKSGRENFSVMCEKGSQVYKQTKDILVWGEASWSYNQLRANTRVSDWEKEVL